MAFRACLLSKLVRGKTFCHPDVRKWILDFRTVDSAALVRVDLALSKQARNAIKNLLSFISCEREGIGLTIQRFLSLGLNDFVTTRKSVPQNCRSQSRPCPDSRSDRCDARELSRSPGARLKLFSARGPQNLRRFSSGERQNSSASTTDIFASFLEGKGPQPTLTIRAASYSLERYSRSAGLSR